MLDSENEEKLSTLMAGGGECPPIETTTSYDLTFLDTNEDADHAYMMFSATFAREARSLARKYMAQDHYRIQVGRPGQSHKNIRQVIKEVDHFQRAQEVLELLEADKSAKTLIFCNGQDSVDTLDAFLYNKGLPVTSSHGGRSQSEREDAL
jgi:ATP-dependent RNA helicase DDX3X